MSGLKSRENESTSPLGNIRVILIAFALYGPIITHLRFSHEIDSGILAAQIFLPGKILPHPNLL
jgi:hypothetical protein